MIRANCVIWVHELLVARTRQNTTCWLLLSPPVPVAGWIRMGDKPIWEQIGSSFVQHYYQLFDTDRTQLGSIYVSIVACRRWCSTEEWSHGSFMLVIIHICSRTVSPPHYVFPLCISIMFVLLQKDIIVWVLRQAFCEAWCFHSSLLPT